MRRLVLHALALVPLTAAAQLPNGSFEHLDGQLPASWHVSVGARTDERRVPSRLQVVEGGADGTRCLRVDGDAATTEWLALQSQAVPVVPGSRVRLSARVKTESVRPEGRQYRNCNVVVAFASAAGERVPVASGPVAGASLVSGTSGWTLTERDVEVPAGAATARVSCFLSMSGTAWFDDVRLDAVAAPAWIVTATERLVFHELEGDRLTDEQRLRSERDLAELESLLGVRAPRPVRFYKYPGNADKERLTGNAGNAHVEGDAVHSIWPTERHELVHVVAMGLGRPGSILLGEGLAVALAGPWQGRPPDEHVRQLAASGRLPKLAMLADAATFRAAGDAVAYPVAGSFVSWLVATHGMARLLEAYPAKGEGPAAFTDRIREVYAVPLEQLETAWLASVLAAR